MKEVNVVLHTIDMVKDFVSKTITFNEEMELIGGKYIVDAKSILAIFSMDLSQPLTLRVNAEADRADAILAEFAEYIV